MNNKVSFLETLNIFKIIILSISFIFILIYWILISIINILIFIINIFLRKKIKYLKYINNNISKNNSYKNNNNNKTSKYKKEINIYNLNKQEQELIKKKENEIYDFEEDGELEDDDYYNEDEK